MDFYHLLALVFCKEEEEEKIGLLKDTQNLLKKSTKRIKYGICLTTVWDSFFWQTIERKQEEKLGFLGKTQKIYSENKQTNKKKERLDSCLNKSI